MKLEFFENEAGVEIRLIPETMKEVNELLRYTRNALAEKPSVTFYATGDQPELSLWLKKKKKSQQYSGFKPYKDTP